MRFGSSVAIVVALVLAGCAALAGKPDEAVRDRAQERWHDLVAGDFKAAYGFLSPGSKAVQSETDYVNSLRPDFWKSARVGEVKCAEKRCDVQVRIEYEFRGHRVSTPVHETWIREGMQWWLLLRS